MFRFSFLSERRATGIPMVELFETEKRRRDASSSLAKALSRKLCHRIDIFRVHPTFVTSSDSFESSRYHFSLSWTKIEREKIRELRTVRLLALESVRQESRCLTRASSSIRCRLAFLRGRPGVYKYDIPWHAKQSRCIIDHVSHTRCCSYFKTFPIWYEEFWSISTQPFSLWRACLYFSKKGRGKPMDFKLIEFQ